MTYLEIIQRLYIGFFGRPADSAGLSYWDQLMTGGGNAQQMSAAFAASAEFQAGTSSPATTVNQIYLNAFGRHAEPAGLSYWAGKLQAGDVSVATVVDAVLSGARGTDALALYGKVAAASAFTATAGQYPDVFSSAASMAFGREWLLGVTSDAKSLDLAFSNLIPEKPGAAAPPPATSENLVQQLHIGYFGRPADTSTIELFQRALAEGHSPAKLAAMFASSAEFQAQVAKGNAHMVDHVFANLFGHAADTAGRAYWIERLDSGAVSPATLVGALATAAVGSDAVTLGHRTIASTAHAEMAVRAAEWLPVWPAVVIGPVEPPGPSKWLANITHDPASLDTALENLYELFNPPQTASLVGVPDMAPLWL